MVDRLVDAGCPIEEVNVGGGLGAPARDDERPIDLDAYAAVDRPPPRAARRRRRQRAGRLHRQGRGDPARRGRHGRGAGGATFVGLDLGWNVNCSYFIYRFAQEIVVCRAPDAPRTQLVTVAGHINEAGDVFAEDYPMPPVGEGDIVAILNAGGYHQAMSSTHCLRPTAPARFLERSRPGSASPTSHLAG